MANHYREIMAWQRAMALAEGAYALTRAMPDSERFGLVSQMQRAAVSVAANIAEGHARRSSRDYRRFLAFASGSLAELETHMLLAQRLGLADPSHVDTLLDLAGETGRLIRGIDRAVAASLA